MNSLRFAAPGHVASDEILSDMSLVLASTTVRFQTREKFQGQDPWFGSASVNHSSSISR